MPFDAWGFHVNHISSHKALMMNINLCSFFRIFLYYLSEIFPGGPLILRIITIIIITTSKCDTHWAGSFCSGSSNLDLVHRERKKFGDVEPGLTRWQYLLEYCCFENILVSLLDHEVTEIVIC